MSAVRVVLADLPHLQRDLIARALDAAPDVEVVVEPDPARLLDAVRAHDADVVVLRCEEGTLSPARLRLLDVRAPQVVGVDPDDGRAFVFRLRPERTAVGSVSPDDIVELIHRSRAEVR